MSANKEIKIKGVDFSTLDPKTTTLRDLYVFLLRHMKGYELGTCTVDEKGDITGFKFIHVNTDAPRDPAWRTELEISQYFSSISFLCTSYHVSLHESLPGLPGKKWSHDKYTSITTYDMQELLTQLDWLFNDFMFDPFIIFG